MGMQAEDLEYLGKVPLFRHLDQEALRRLAAQMRLVSLPKGPIIRENDPSDALYVIKSGVASVTKSSEDASVGAVLALLQPGSSFGELGVLDGGPRSATVVAMQSMQCYVFSRESFQKAVQKHPAIALGLLPALAAMVRNADRWVGSRV